MTTAIHVRALSKTFGGGRRALCNVDFDVLQGEMVALIGASGSGTSPLIPLDPLAMRSDMPAATKAKIADFFYTYGKGSPQEKENLMKLWKLSGFKESSNRQLI